MSTHQAQGLAKATGVTAPAKAVTSTPVSAETDMSSGGDSLARVRWSTMQLLALMGVASIAFSALN